MPESVSHKPAQVLSAGGDVGADQVEDTTAVTRARAQADFLPIALVLGLTPGARAAAPTNRPTGDTAAMSAGSLEALGSMRPAMHVCHLSKA